MKRIFLFLCVAACLQAHTQVRINAGTTFIVQSNTFLVVTGNLSSNATITGKGTVVMRGALPQTIHFNNLTIPNLQIYNSQNVRLLSPLRIGSSLSFITGKLQTGNFNLLLSASAVASGAGSGKFVETDGTGDLRKLVVANLTGFLMPVGRGSRYEPVKLSTSATYSSALISVKNYNSAHPNKPAGSSSYLNTYWKVGRSGITGTVTADATYTDADITGTEGALLAYFYNGSTFSTSGNSITPTSNLLKVNVPVSGDVYGMSNPAGAAMRPGAEATEQADASISIAPNPVVSTATITLPSAHAAQATISILDNNGKLAIQRSVSLVKGRNQYLVNMSQLIDGAYQVRIQSAGIDQTFTVIKQ